MTETKVKQVVGRKEKKQNRTENTRREKKGKEQERKSKRKGVFWLIKLTNPGMFVE